VGVEIILMGGDGMPAINYLAEVDRLKAKKDLKPIIEDMSERELRVALFYVLHGMEIYEAIDSARWPEKLK
jgi:hypothetical protein